MRHNLKLVVWILILIGVLLVLSRFFDFSREPELVSDPSLRKSVAADAYGNPVGTMVLPEPGRVVKNFFPALPEGFPADMPIDPLPVRVVKSYMETMEGDRKEGELRHTQLTYAYITQQNGSSMADVFEKYLKDKNFEVDKNEDGSLWTIFGETEDSTLTVNITIFLQNQFERLVTVSIIGVEKFTPVPRP